MPHVAGHVLAQQGIPGPPPGFVANRGAGGGGGSTTPPVTDQTVQEGSGDTASLLDQLLFGTASSGTDFVGSTSQPTTSETQQESLNALLQLIANMLQSGNPTGDFNSAFSQFGGQAPGITPLQAMSLTGLERIAGGELDVFTGAGGEEARNALSGALNAPGQDTTELFNQTVAGPAQEDFVKALDALNLSAVGSENLFGSERSSERVNTTEDFIDSLLGQRRQFAFDAESLARQQRLEALGLAPTILGMDVARGTDLLGAGEVQRNAEFQQFITDIGLFDSDRAREQGLLQMLLGGSVAPTFGVSGGFALPNSTASGGGVLGGVLESIV